MKISYYFDKPVRPTRLGEVRRPDKVEEADISFSEILTYVKDKMEGVHFVGFSDEENTKERVRVWKTSYGYSVHVRKLNDLLELIKPDFIKKKVEENTGPMLGDTKAYIVKMSKDGYIFAVSQHSHSDVEWKLYEDKEASYAN